MNLKNILCYLFIIIFSLTIGMFTSCSSVNEFVFDLDDDYDELFSKEELVSKGHKNILPEFITDTSICYLNNDGTKTVYIYAAPIRFIGEDGQLSMIDTRITNTKDLSMRENGYIYTVANNDIKTFFPKETSTQVGVKLKREFEYEFGFFTNEKIRSKCGKQLNFIGKEKNMITYTNAFGQNTQLNLYPSSIGCNAEIIFNDEPTNNEFSYWLKIYDNTISLLKSPGDYFTLINKNTKEIFGVIQRPLLKDKDGNISYKNTMEIVSQSEGLYHIKFILDEDVLKKDSVAFLSFEMRREKQPDNAIYSGRPNLENAFLSNFSIIGSNQDYGRGRLMIRYLLKDQIGSHSKQIKNAYFHIYNLNHNNGETYELLTILDDWCSVTGNWNKQYKTGDKISLVEQKSRELEFDITNEVIKWCNAPNNIPERYGLLLKTVNENENHYNVLLSNDNSLYLNRTEIVFNS